MVNWGLFNESKKCMGRMKPIYILMKILATLVEVSIYEISDNSERTPVNSEI